jgi:prevent-host-death family protein
METITLADAKTRFSAILKDVRSGNEVAISYGKQKEKIAVIIPYKTWKKSKKRQLGTLKGIAAVGFSKHFLMTDEEVLHS